MIELHRYTHVPLRAPGVLLLRAQVTGRWLRRWYVGLVGAGLVLLGLAGVLLLSPRFAGVHSHVSTPLLLAGIVLATYFSQRTWRLQRGRGHVDEIRAEAGELRLRWAFGSGGEVRRDRPTRRLRILITDTGTSRWFYGESDEPWLTFGLSPKPAPRVPFRQLATETVVREIAGLLGRQVAPQRVTLPNGALAITFPGGSPTRGWVAGLASTQEYAEANGGMVEGRTTGLLVDQRGNPFGRGGWSHFCVVARGKGAYEVSARRPLSASSWFAKPSFTVTPGGLRYRYGHLMWTTAEASWVRDVVVIKRHSSPRDRHGVQPSVAIGLVTWGHPNPHVLLEASVEYQTYLDLAAVDLYEEAERVRAGVLGVLRRGK